MINVFKANATGQDVLLGTHYFRVNFYGAVLQPILIAIYILQLEAKITCCASKWVCRRAGEPLCPWIWRIVDL